MFKIGDKVRIKSWEQMEFEFGLNIHKNIDCHGSFLTNMKYLCGKEIVIEEIYENLIQSIDYWIISFDMIEKI